MNPQNQNDQSPQESTQPKRNNKKVALIVVGVFLLLIAIGAIIAYVTTNKTAQVAEEFVAAVTSKDFDKGYTYFSPELKQAHSREAFEQALSPAPFDNSCKLEITSRESGASTDKGTTKKIAGDIKCSNASYPIELEFVDIDAGEKINIYSIKPAEN